jgi:hypothetical protein
MSVLNDEEIKNIDGNCLTSFTQYPVARNQYSLRNSFVFDDKQ